MRNLLAVVVVALLFAAIWFLRTPPQPVVPAETERITRAQDSAAQQEEISLRRVDDRRETNAFHAAASNASATRNDASYVMEVEAPAAWTCPPNRSRLTLRLLRLGRPVADARVSAQDSPDAQVDGATPDDPTAERAVGRTNSRGRISFFVRPTKTVEFLAVDTVTGEAVRTHFTSTFAGKERIVTLEFPVPNGGEGVRITVVSEQTGAPVAGCFVSRRGSKTKIAALVSTGIDGGGVAPFEAGDEILFRANGFCSKQVTFPPMEGQGSLTIKLREHMRLHGRVAASAESDTAAARSNPARPKVPAAVIEVFVPVVTSKPKRKVAAAKPAPVHESGWLFQMAQSGESRVRQGAVLSADVAPDGSWAIDGIELVAPSISEGAIVTLVRRPGDSEMRRLVAQDIPLRAGTDLEVLDPWMNSPSWRIEARYAGSGEPVGPGVTLSLRPDRGDGEVNGVTDPNGAARLESIPKGAWSYELGSGLEAPQSSRKGGLIHNGQSLGEIRVDGCDVIRGKITGLVRERRPVLVRATIEGRSNTVEISRSDGGFAFHMVPTEKLVTLTAIRRVQVANTQESLMSGEVSSSHWEDEEIGQVIVQAGDTHVVLPVSR